MKGLEEMITLNQMRVYLSKSLSSVNQNKIRGLLAEVEFRQFVSELGFGGNISAGGWIVRNVRTDRLDFSDIVLALFPETVQPDADYPSGRPLSPPPSGIHTICATMHQIGIHSYYLYPEFADVSDPLTVQWRALQLGIPQSGTPVSLDQVFSKFSPRKGKYNFLRYSSNTSGIPDPYVPEEFSKELLRVSFQNGFMTEISDIDAILWGQQHTYPVEIKEKTPASDSKLGEYFGLDVGPFVKLAFYAAKRGMLHSLFVVREIDDPSTRNLVEWRFITFDTLAQYASWLFGKGGANMQGGQSAVVRIPKSKFKVLNAESLSSL